MDKFLSRTLIQGKYSIDQFIDRGSCGQVVAVNELGKSKSGSPLILKILTSFSCFKNEVQAMTRIHRRFKKRQDQWRQGECPVPRVVDCGLLF